LYQSERYGTFSYNIPLANGNYTVTLKFAEIYWTAAGQRIFNVSMQGTQVINNLDIYALVGKNTAYDVSIPVSVTNGTLNINFTSIVNYANVSAIVITGTAGSGTALSPDTTPPSVPAGLSATVISSSQINLSWSASTDPIVPGQLTAGLAGYNVFRNGTQVATTTTTNYSDTGLSASTPYSYAVSAHDADGNQSAQSTSISATTLSAVATTNTVAFAANAGGGQYTSQAGVAYEADTDYSGGSTFSTTGPISGTSDPALYQTVRYGNFSYNIPLANGNYNVTLKFAEIYWNSAGKRIFDVSMQGTQVISNLDIYALVGINSAYAVSVPVSVTNGILNISFSSVIDNAIVSAIVVSGSQSSTPPDPPENTSTSFAADAGGQQYTSQSGLVFQADMDYSGGSTASTTAPITGTSDPTLYQSVRYGNFSYNIPLADGNYTVTLKFAEIYWTSAGKRIFNVSMQGTQVISNLDIYSLVGINSAYDVSVPVSVTDGVLNINFTSVEDYACVSAIEVTPN
jgi:chitodextrinase